MDVTKMTAFIDNFAKMDASKMKEFTDSYANNHMNPEEKKEYEQACDVIADDLEKNPEIARDKFRERFISGLRQDVEDYRRGVKYAVRGNTFIETMELGRALRCCDEANKKDVI